MPPQCGAFSRDLQDKSQSPRYSLGVGGPWLQMTSALCVAVDHSQFHADSEDSDQTGWMPRLIRVFTGRKAHSNPVFIPR